MSHKKVIALLPLFLILVAASDDLDYKDRGSRYEGRKSSLSPERGMATPGFHLEIIGAMVEPLPDSSEEMQDYLSVHFVPETEGVLLTIREREAENNYWLDQAKPETEWRAMVTNTFIWPSSDVVRPLGLRPADLVVLVQLEPGQPTSHELVAPALFKPSAGGRRIRTYHFVFKVRPAADVGYAFYGPDSDKPLDKSCPERRFKDKPFDIIWEAENQPEGRYRLEIKGHYIGGDEPINRVFEFFHSPSWQY